MFQESTRLNPGPYPLLIVATMTALIQGKSPRLSRYHQTQSTMKQTRLFHKSEPRSEHYGRGPRVDVPPHHRPASYLELGPSLVPAVLHGHGGHPEPGGDRLPQPEAALQPRLLLDRHPQGGGGLDLGGHQQEPDARGSELGGRGAQQRVRGLRGDVHQAG